MLACLVPTQQIHYRCGATAEIVFTGLQARPQHVQQEHQLLLPQLPGKSDSHGKQTGSGNAPDIIILVAQSDGEKEKIQL
jgi:hypothetical protein